VSPERGKMSHNLIYTKEEISQRIKKLGLDNTEISAVLKASCSDKCCLECALSKAYSILIHKFNIKQLLELHLKIQKILIVHEKKLKQLQKENQEPRVSKIDLTQIENGKAPGISAPTRKLR
jgi:hypothetical protein